jgi:predicted nucleic acid-binding protein
MVYAALLDTSVVIDLESIGDQQVAAALGVDVSEFRPGISTVTLAELAAGPHATDDPAERAVRQARLQWAEAVFEPLGFDEDAARAYGVVYALVRAEGRKARGRLADLLIASIALANGLPLLTRNPKDFVGVDNRVRVIAV